VYLPSNLDPAFVKDQILSPAEQKKEGKHEDGTVEPRYLFKQIPVTTEDQARLIYGKEEAAKGEQKKSG